MALSDPVPLVRPCFPQRILVLSIHQPRLQKLTLRFPAVVRHRFIHVHVSFASLRRPHTSSFKSAIISRLIYLQPRSCDRASFILNTVNIGIENEMILENRYWMLSSYGNKFQREIILTEKKKIEARILIFEFESRNKGTIATKCKEIQIDGDILVLLHTYTKRKPLEHSFPFFLCGYVCSNLI